MFLVLAGWHHARSTDAAIWRELHPHFSARSEGGGLLPVCERRIGVMDDATKGSAALKATDDRR